MNYLVKIFLIFILFISCNTDNDCFCTETTTNIQNNTVFVDEYWLDDCNESFTVLETYNWGNIVIDCR